MKLSFEKTNKWLLLVALASLIYRLGNFSSSFIPKPFEILFVVLILATVVYLLKDGKVKEFFLSIPKKIWIALLVLIGSIFLGWSFSSLVGIPSAPLYNIFLELGTFGIGLILFIMILFYTRDDENYSKYCLYALLIPVVYVVFIFFHPLATYLGMNISSHFLGFTVNPNTVSKILLIPAIFFIGYSLFESKNTWLKVLFIFVSSSLISLIFWTASRGALVSLAVGIIFVFTIYMSHEFNWRKFFLGAGIIAIMLFLGFNMLPNIRQEAVTRRIVTTIVAQQNLSTETSSVTTRLIIWPFYIKYVLLHPLGIGPDTHKYFGLTDNNGIPLNSGPHNTYLQMWLWGGILGILSFLYILFSAFRNLKRKLKLSFNKFDVAVLSILIALSVSVFFDDSLSFYWFFIILALSLTRLKENYEEKKVQTI